MRMLKVLCWWFKTQSGIEMFYVSKLIRVILSREIIVVFHCDENLAIQFFLKTKKSLNFLFLLWTQGVMNFSHGTFFVFFVDN